MPDTAAGKARRGFATADCTRLSEGLRVQISAPRIDVVLPTHRQRFTGLEGNLDGAPAGQERFARHVERCSLVRTGVWSRGSGWNGRAWRQRRKVGLGPIFTIGDGERRVADGECETSGQCGLGANETMLRHVHRRFDVRKAYIAQGRAKVNDGPAEDPSLQRWVQRLPGRAVHDDGRG